MSISGNRFLLRAVLLSLSIITVTSAKSVGLEAVSDGDDGFYLTLDDQATGTLFATDLTGDIFSIAPTTTIDFSGDISNPAGVGYYLGVHVDKEESDNGRHDIAFVKRSTTGVPTTLVIARQGSSEGSYIESVEVKWSDKAPAGGSLCIHGKTTRYEKIYATFSQYFSDEDVLNAVVSPSEDPSEVTLYYPKTPVKYIAITSADEDQTVARVEYIKLHFVPNEPNIGTTGIDTMEEFGGNYAVTPEYFTTGGIKVTGDDLAPGLYIKRQGTKAEKILIRR